MSEKFSDFALRATKTHCFISKLRYTDLRLLIIESRNFIEHGTFQNIDLVLVLLLLLNIRSIE